MEKCRRMKRLHCMSKNLIYSWLWKSPTTRQQYRRSDSFAMKTNILMNGSTVKKCNTENFVATLIPGLSTSSSSNFPSATFMTPSRQEIDHLTSSSSSSTSPTATVQVNMLKRRERVDKVGLFAAVFAAAFGPLQQIKNYNKSRTNLLYSQKKPAVSQIKKFSCVFKVFLFLGPFLLLLQLGVLSHWLP